MSSLMMSSLHGRAVQQPVAVSSRVARQPIPGVRCRSLFNETPIAPADPILVRRAYLITGARELHLCTRCPVTAPLQLCHENPRSWGVVRRPHAPPPACTPSGPTSRSAAQGISENFKKSQEAAKLNLGAPALCLLGGRAAAWLAHSLL